ncbi:hypothetical protein SEVIR_5G206800v4 [Setaria viridis]|uniref:KIB1-4 beta-propeller domain-containing protein n=1 Tax=Setaria viridis TaxID=4556 RepID=A0A4U6UFZ7_SETVI|nr:hypothetical protein SEVIR_5G206800v2 [Setaria viridis]
MECCNWYEDIFYNDDDILFYAIKGNGEIHTIDLNDHSPVVKVIFEVESHIFMSKNYIVQTPWGDLLRVKRQYPDPPRDIAESDDGYHQSSNQEVEDSSLDEEDDSDDTDQPNDDSEVENNLLHELDRTGKLTVHRVDLAKREATEVQNLRDKGATCRVQRRVHASSSRFSTIFNLESYLHCARQLACVDLEDGSFTDLSLPDSVLNWPSPVWLKSLCSLQK